MPGQGGGGGGGAKGSRRVRNRKIFFRGPNRKAIRQKAFRRYLDIFNSDANLNFSATITADPGFFLPISMAISVSPLDIYPAPTTLNFIAGIKVFVARDSIASGRYRY